MSKVSWIIDPAHSEIGFKVKHMMFTTVSGHFDKFSAEIESDGDSFENASVDFKAETASVNTNNGDRDNHLRSADFFDSENYPSLLFKSDTIKKLSDNKYLVKGMMTIKDVSKEIELNADYSGLLKDPWGNSKAGFLLETTINRKDFGLTWNAALETGGVLVSEDVRIICEIQLQKQ